MLRKIRSVLNHRCTDSQAQHRYPSGDVASRTGNSQNLSSTPRSRLESLPIDVLLLIGEWLDMRDRLRLSTTNRFLRALVTESPTFWRNLRLQISGGETGHGNPRLPERRLPDTRFTPRLGTLRLLLSRSEGVNQEVHLELQSLSHTQCLKIVDVLQPHAANLQALSIDANRCEEMPSSFLNFASFELPNVRFLRIIDIAGETKPNVHSHEEISAEEVYNLTLPSSVPLLQTLYLQTQKPQGLYLDSILLPVLSRLKDFDIGHPVFRRAGTTSEAVRQILEKAKLTTRRAIFRYMVMYSSTPHAVPIIDLPLLEQLHLDCIFYNEGVSLERTAPIFFDGFRLHGLRSLSLCALAPAMRHLHLTAPNLRRLSFELWPYYEGAGTILGEHLALLTSVEQLELVAHKGYGLHAEQCEFFRSFIQEALPGLPSANPLHLSPGHPVALPRLQELSMRRFITPRGFKNDWPANHVTPETKLAVPILLRRGRLPSLLPCPPQLVGKEEGTERVELSSLPTLPLQYQTMHKLWAQEATVERFWDEVEEQIAIKVPEDERSLFTLACNERDVFWDRTEPPFPRAFQPLRTR